MQAKQDNPVSSFSAAYRGRSNIKRMSFIASLVTAVSLLPASAREQMTPSEQRGQRLAITYCDSCHSIDKVTESQLKLAPPFRVLHRRYPIETLEEALAEGIITGHPTMPEFQFEVDQIVDFIAFLKTLER